MVYTLACFDIKVMFDFIKRAFYGESPPVYVPPIVNYMLDEEWWEEDWLAFMETTDTLGDLDEQWASHYSMMKTKEAPR